MMPLFPADDDAAGPGTMASYSTKSSASTLALSSVLLLASDTGGFCSAFRVQGAEQGAAGMNVKVLPPFGAEAGWLHEEPHFVAVGTSSLKARLSFLGRPAPGGLQYTERQPVYTIPYQAVAPTAPRAGHWAHMVPAGGEQLLQSPPA